LTLPALDRSLSKRTLDVDLSTGGANAAAAACLSASDVQSPGAVADAMAAHALSLVVLRNAASALAESGAALEAALAQAAREAADGTLLSQSAGAAVVAANAA
jgi:alkyl hydroperoxide reductase subunit AhpF